MKCPKCGEENSSNAKFCQECASPLLQPVETVIDTQISEDYYLDDLKAALKDKYEIIREIGRGGMGIVYECKELTFDLTVALKVLPKELSYDKKFVERFKREIKILQKIEHKNIVQIIDADEANGFIYFTMKYINGQNLAEIIKEKGELQPKEAMYIAFQISQALSYAHELNVLHRDLKPENVMVDESEHVYLMDFGISRVLDGTRITRTGAAIGTPEYMSPEQCHGEVEIDGRSDIYSLGIIMYEMLTGKVPFIGEATSVMYQHVNVSPTPLTYMRKVSRFDVVDIINSCIEKKPEDRPQNATELVKLLDDVLNDVVVTNKKTKIKKKNSSTWGWILWWRIDEEELSKQVNDYENLIITQSVRGVSFLLIIFSVIITSAITFFTNTEYINLLDAVLFLVLGIFIYFGHRWSMLLAMVYWTIAKVFSISLDNSSSLLISIGWWCIYMHAFYGAFKVETIRIKNLKHNKLKVDLKN